MTQRPLLPSLRQRQQLELQELVTKQRDGEFCIFTYMNLPRCPSTLCLVVLVLPWHVGLSAVQLPWRLQVTSSCPSKVKSWLHVKEHWELNAGARFEQLMWPFSGASSNGHVTTVKDRMQEGKLQLDLFEAENTPCWKLDYFFALALLPYWMITEIRLFVMSRTAEHVGLWQTQICCLYFYAFMSNTQSCQ